MGSSMVKHSQLTYKELKAQHRQIRENHPEGHRVRIHRALSWLNKAEQSADDDDAQIIFLWIAFNAAYANEYDIELKKTAQDLIYQFFNKIVQLDKDNLLYDLIWTEFSSSIRLLLDNKHIYQPFWDSQSGKLDELAWKKKFKTDNEKARRALSKKDTSRIIWIVFNRLYTLRNQLMHGGATWKGGKNREQVRDAPNLLSKVVPVIIKIMMDNPDTLWGDPCYPVVE